MIDFDALLSPVTSAHPAGEPLRYEGTYDVVRDARREDDARAPLGVWQHELKVADWAAVRRLCFEAIAFRSKDLQLGAWLLESLIRLDGFAGAAEGLRALLLLAERYWDDAYPRQDDDPEVRAAPFVWLNEKLPATLAQVPVTAPEGTEGERWCWADWQDAIAAERVASRAPSSAAKVRSEVPVTRDRFLEMLVLTPPEFYDACARDLHEAAEQLRALQHLLDDRMGPDAPSLVRLREGIYALRDWAALTASDHPRRPGLAAVPVGAQAEPDSPADELPMARNAPIASREEAYRRLREAADWLAQAEPHSPTPYLVRRAVEWGELSLMELFQRLAEAGLDPNALRILMAPEPRPP